MAAETSHYSYWRVGVCGSSQRLSKQAAEMCEMIGARLAREETVVIVHGGFKRRKSQPDVVTLAADWHFIDGAKRVLHSDYQRRLETVLPEATPEPTNPADRRPDKVEIDDERFVEGSLRYIKGRTREARRFALVGSLDAIVAVGGGHGTRQQLTLAAAIDQPVLPVPWFMGAAADFWKMHYRDLLSQFGIDEATAKEWEREPASSQDIEQQADSMVSALLDQLPKRVFVIMPFATEFDTLYDLVIDPAVKTSRDEIRRLDRSQAPGEIIRQIAEGIRTSDYCIVVLDGLRSNVLYEMGYAQALGKPLILVVRKGDLDQQDIPFDISTLQRIEYVRPDARTLDQLRNAVRQVVRRGRS